MKPFYNDCIRSSDAGAESGRAGLKFASLGSGSKGNATLVECSDTLVMVDCGFSVRETRRRLQRLGRTLEDVAAILVTHEHGDHISGVMPLARSAGIPVYMSKGTALAVSGSRHSTANVHIETINAGQGFALQALQVLPVAVSHDAQEPCQFRFTSENCRHLGVLSDLGEVTPGVIAAFSRCHALMLESNHDPGMLENGPYPWSLKQRVAGARGHLSNQQAAAMAASLDKARLQHLVLSHLSEQNNSPAHVRAAFAAGGHENVDALAIASQHSGFDWLEIQ